MSKIPDNRTESVFEDFKKPYTTTQALVEANRCLYCYDAPCITACPTGIDIPKFIRRIANDNQERRQRYLRLQHSWYELCSCLSCGSPMCWFLCIQ